MKAILYTLILGIIITTISGCSIFGKEKSRNSSDQMDQSGRIKINRNKVLTKELKKEKGIMDGQVYTHENYAIATIVVKKNVKKQAVNKIVAEYSSKLKKEYKGKKINVQAIQNGKNIANKLY